MIKSTRQYRAVPSFDEVMKSEQAKPIPSFDEVMGGDKKKVPTVGGDVSNNSSQNTNLSLGGEKNQISQADKNALANFAQNLNKGNGQNVVKKLPTKNVLTQVGFKRRLTNEEVEKKAQERLSDPYNQLAANNSDDPIGSYYNTIQNSKASSITGQNKIQDENEAAIHDKMGEMVVANTFPTSQSASDYLHNELKKKTGQDVPIGEIDLPTLKQQLPDNLSTRTAIQKLGNNRFLTSLMNESKNFGEFVDKYKNASSKFIGMDDERQQAQAYQQILNDPDVAEVAKQNPKTWGEYLQERHNFINKFPDLAKQDIASKISQYREDVGKNNKIFNNPSKESWDKVVDEMYSKGKIDAQEKAFYNQNIKPSDLKTTGLIESVGRGYEEGIRQIGQTIGLQDLGLLKDMSKESQVNPTNNKILGGGGHLMGNIVPMLLTGGALKGAGFGEKAANGFAAMLQFGGGNAEQAKKYFPNNPIGQFAYTALGTTIDTMLMDLPTRAQHGIRQLISGEAKQLAAKLSDTAISDAGKEQMKQSFVNKFINASKRYGIDILKHNVQTAGVLTSVDLLHKGLNLAAGDKSAFEGTDLPKEFVDNFLMASPLSAISAAGALLPKQKSELNTAINELPDNMYTSEIKKSLNEGNVPKLETYLKDISEQLNNPQSSEVTRKVFGEKLSDIATKLYPNAKSEPINIEQPINQGSGEYMPKGEQGVVGELGKGVEVGANSSGEGVGDKTVESEVNKLNSILNLTEKKADFSKMTDAEIEKRMMDLEDSKTYGKEFDDLEKEMEKRERNTVFSVPLDKVSDAVDALMKKDKEQPNGYGSFIERRDASETKDVAEKYLNPKEISDAELKKDFKDAVLGRPETWYADGLKLRESMKEAANRGIDTQEMVREVEKEFEKDGYTAQDAKEVVARRLSPIFKNSERVETNENKLVGNEVSIPTEKESTPIKEPNQNIQNTKDRLSEIYKKSPSKIDKILKDFEGDYSISSLAKEVVEQNKKPFKAATDEEIKRVKQAKSVGEVLGIIQETTIDPHLKEVAKVIAENLHKAPFLKLEFDLPKDRYGYPVDANGSYGGGIATINPSSFWKRTNNYHSRGLDTGYKTILHELTHAFTIDAYRSPKTPIEKEFRNYIDKTYKELKSNSMFDKQYGFKSQEEFIAEVLTNPEFRLSAPIYKSGILDKIIEYVAKIFGYNKDKDAISDARYEKIKEAFDFILKKIPDIRAGEGKKIFYEEGDLLGRLADAYHKAKESGKNPELVKAVEELLNEKSDEISKPTESESLATKKVDTNIQPTSEGEKAIEQSPIGKPIEVQQQEQEQRQPPNGIEPPSETPPVEKKGVYVERPATELSHRGLQDVANEFSLDDVKPRTRKSDIQLRQDAENTVSDWKEKGEYAKNIEELTKRAETNGNLNDEERVIMEQHLANVIGEARKLDKNSPEYDAKLQEIKRLKDAGEITRSAAGAALRIPTNSGSYPRTVEDAMVERMEAAGVDTLTPEQKKDVEEKFSMYEAKQKEAEERIADLEKKNMELQAEIELAKQRKATKTVKKDFKAERQNIRNSIKEKWAKAANDNTLTAVPLPYAKQLAAISPDVAKLMKSYIEEGITTFSEIVDKIHDDIKDVVKNREDVIDILAGKYNEPKESKIDLLTKLKRIKDRKSAEAIKIIAKLRTGDFEKAQKPKSIFDNPDLIKKYPKEYKQTMDAIVASEKAKHELAIANLNEEMKNRTWGQKTVGEVGRVFRTLKALKAGIDDSGVGVQTLLAGLANPVSFAAAFKEHLLDATSAARFERNLARLHNSDFWPLIEKSGLSVVDPKSLRESEKNDIFNDTYFDYMKVKIKGKEYSFAFTKPFERAFTSLGNNLRVNMFLRRAEELMNNKKNPMTYETHPEEFEALAKVINNLSGRGTMNSKLEAHNQLLSTVLWSPKLLASSINVLGLGEFSGKGFYRSLTPMQRKYVAAQLVRGIGTGVILMAILSTSQDGESDLDPLSPTFGTVKVGSYRYTIFGRYNSVVRTAAMIVMREKHTTKGVDDLTDRRGTSLQDELIKFVRGKANPTLGIGWDVVTGKTYEGKPTDPMTEISQSAIPMSVDDIKKGLAQDGTLGILKRGIPSFFGVKVSNESDFAKPSSSNGGGAGAKGSFKKSSKQHNKSSKSK